MKKIDENYFIEPNNIKEDANTIDSVLQADEDVLWRGKPNKKSFILSNILKGSIIAFIFLIFDISFITILFTNLESVPTALIIFLCIFFAFHLIPFWIWISSVITIFKRWKNEEYAFTSQRIIIKKGFIGSQIQSIYYSSLTSVNLKIGVIEKLYKVGDIYIVSSQGKTVMDDIDNAYFLSSRLQKIAHDIKTDIIFPNDLRPKTNKGYKTEYKDE
ncbi:MAG: PH domain-containing protein [Firmicutes bacterium]|uniref:PH domain-containing protein n=1 Tax=Candidatus Onthovivens merdipullorum TaxID=2840889 RepID=A0A9D9DKB4_9BACL|nr:PH domain-containing protein [Candidatus Onthovivens merdipullorum]